MYSIIFDVVYGNNLFVPNVFCLGLKYTRISINQLKILGAFKICKIIDIEHTLVRQILSTL